MLIYNPFPPSFCTSSSFHIYVYGIASDNKYQMEYDQFKIKTLYVRMKPKHAKDVMDGKGKEVRVLLTPCKYQHLVVEKHIFKIFVVFLRKINKKFQKQLNCIFLSFNSKNRNG